DANESTTIAGDVYVFEEPGKTHFGAFPFYFAGREGETAYDLFLPVPFYRATDGTSSSFFLLNTFYSSTAHGYGFASVPLAFAGSDGQESFVCVPPGLFFHRSDATSSTTVAGPFYHHEKPQESWTGFAPLWFSKSDEAGDGSRIDAVPPLVLYRESAGD